MEGIIGQMMSSHLAAMRVLPDSARSLKIEMNIWDLTSVSKKSMKQKTAIVSNKDQAPFYPSVFFRCLKILKNILTLRSSWNRCSWQKYIYSTQSVPKKPPQSAIFWRKNLRNLSQEEMALDLSSER